MVERTTSKSWAEHWADLGPRLEKIERDELREFSFQRSWQTVDGLLQLGADVANSKSSSYSGLIEQQRLFSKGGR